MGVGQLGHRGGSVGTGILRLHGEVDDPLRGERDVRGVEGSVGERGTQRGFGARASGHLEIHARGHRGGAVGGGAPVTHDDPVEPPTLAQNVGE